MPKTKMLIIEDEEPILKGLIDVFTYHGFDVDGEANGRVGLEKALANSYDMILLDLMLPEMDGFEVCNRIRSADRKQPIIILTAKTSDEDIVKGLSFGADDYVTKPFSLQQLKARVDAVLRRSNKSNIASKMIKIGELEIDTATLIGRRQGNEILFTRRELELLLYLESQGSRAVTRSELLREVWGYQNAELLETRTVDIHVAKLRKKLEADPLKPKYLVTVRSEGYRLSGQG